MKKIALIVLICLFFAACSTQEAPLDEDIQSEDTEQIEPDRFFNENEPTLTKEVDYESLPTDTIAPSEIVETISPPLGTAGPDCLGPEPNEIGLGIAERFPETTYEQVMTWFCDGAEFEDILVALQTENLTDFPAGEMLQMLADDWTWDEIWQVIGLTEE